MANKDLEIITERLYFSALTSLKALEVEVEQHIQQRLNETNIPVPNVARPIVSEMKSAAELYALTAKLLVEMASECPNLVFTSGASFDEMMVIRAGFLSMIRRVQAQIQSFLTIQPASWRLILPHSDSESWLERRAAAGAEMVIGHRDPNAVMRYGALGTVIGAGLTAIIAAIAHALGYKFASVRFVLLVITGELGVGFLLTAAACALVKWVNRITGRTKFQNLEEELKDKLRLTQLPRQADLARMKEWLDSFVLNLVDASKAKCAFCDRMMISCLEPIAEGILLPHAANGEHQPQCHGKTFDCGHRACKECLERTVQCSCLVVPAAVI